MNYTDKVDAFSIEKLKSFLEFHLNRDELNELRFDTDGNSKYHNNIALHVQRSFFGERRTDVVKVVFKKPASPWDHFKEKYFSRWLLSKFHVKYEHVTKYHNLDRTWSFPDVPSSRYTDRFVIQDNHTIS